ncbi:MAG: nucleotidyltransferase domain-containing protein [Promethearchaeota archaeon]
MALLKPKEITKDLMQDIIFRIIKVCNPEKIILFGSYSTQNFDQDSDIDLLIILKISKLPRHQRSIPINLELSNIVFPMDILVYTEEEIDEWSEVPQAFITSIISKGKILYEKERQ